MRIRPRLLAASLILLLAASTRADTTIFQYTIPTTTTKNETSTAYLWLPPNAKHIRGIIVSGQTLIEKEMSKDPLIRQACADQSLAILFSKTGLLGIDLQKTLDDLAEKSGYSEISQAPLFFVGHSAGGPQARQLAANLPDRTFGLMQFRGGGPWAGPPQTQPATQPTTNPAAKYVPAYIPCLMMTGQFDEFGGTRKEDGSEPAWQNPRNDLAAQRAATPDSLWSMVVEPGAGHFAWSEKNAKYLALFIKKAAAQIPADLPADGSSPKLTRLDPSKGWLADMSLKPASKIPSAPVSSFTGDKSKTSWLFDEELAKAFADFHVGLDRKDQYIKWNDPYNVDAGVRFFFSKPTWVDDGVTLEVHPAYWDKIPARWAFAGEPAQNGGTPILVKTVAVALKPVGPNKFRIYYDAVSPATEGGRITFMAYTEGNDEFRHAEQAGMLPKNFGPIKTGKDNTITFPPIGNLKTTSAPITLNAATDSGLKVDYYVAEGPATITNGNILKLAEIPARAKFPITVRVVAWQFGSLIAPTTKSATPVEQTILIEKP